MMNEHDKLRIYVEPSRISRLPRGYRNIDSKAGDRWVWFTLFLIALSGAAMLYGFWRLFK